MQSIVLCVLALALLPNLSHAQAPVFTVTPGASSVKFFVKSSVALAGKFDKWDATLTFPSTDVTTGALNITIHAASVDTGSGIKNDRLRSKEFFNVKHDPLITFRSTKGVQTGPLTFKVAGNFTIRGVTKPETLMLTVFDKGTRSGTIRGVMTFNRKDFGMNKGIPFVRIGDHVDVTVKLKVKRVSGSPLVFK
jgi:polyisoprenoid-binding protein YceI